MIGLVMDRLCENARDSEKVRPPPRMVVGFLALYAVEVLHMIGSQSTRKFVAKTTRLKQDEACLTQQGNDWKGLTWRVVEVLADQDKGRERVLVVR